jgi:hypothetical protein
VINSDRLAAWWEAEAQDYLTNHPLGNFKDRQVRAWGDCNSQFWRYHESVIGDHPEFNALDFHCFGDVDLNVDALIINSSSLPLDHRDRCNDGTQSQLKKTLKKAWAQLPSWRIVEDVMRYPIAIDKCVEFKGGVVEDFFIQHNGCSKRKRTITEPSRSVVLPPEVVTVAKTRQAELREQARRGLMSPC